ncbi:MAG TPA: AAA family ATPase [Candidatus Binatia bacterium]|nr:AAA family ATPase [Candidatus Binatia bacterium]
MASRIGVRLEIDNPGVRQALEQYVASLGEFALQREEDPGLPQLLILGLDETNPSETFARIRSVQQTSPSTDIFLTAGRADPQLLLEVLRAGVKEFLTQPLRPEEVQHAFQRFRERHAEANAGELKRSGKILSVIGGKSGVGTTTVASNLAVALQAGGSRAVAVVDLNLRGGDVPAFFDINPLRSIRDIELDLSRLDNTFLATMMSKHSSGIEVLALGDGDLAGVHVSAECVDRTLKLMRAMYDFVVVDCGHNIDMATYSSLGLSASVLLVSTLSVPVVRRTKRLLDQLRGEDGSGLEGSSFYLLVNAYTDREELILTETKDVLQLKPQWLLPRDFDTATDALNNGRPVVEFAPRSALSKGVIKVASDLAGAAAGPPRASFLSGVFRSVSEKIVKTNPSPSVA